MNDFWLTCVSVADGMFSNERTIEVRRSDGEPLVFFVHGDQVRVNGGRAAVRVNVRSGKQVRLAMLPTSDRQIIAVREADLEPV